MYTTSLQIVQVIYMYIYIYTCTCALGVPCYFAFVCFFLSSLSLIQNMYTRASHIVQLIYNVHVHNLFTYCTVNIHVHIHVHNNGCVHVPVHNLFTYCTGTCTCTQPLYILYRYMYLYTTLHTVQLMCTVGVKKKFPF